MATTRQLSNGQKLTDWTDEIREIPNQYGEFNDSGLFTGKGVTQDSITFEKETSSITLIPQTSRRGGKPSKGNDRKREIFSLPLPYFNHQDAIVPQDVQGFKGFGSPDSAETLGAVVADKLEDMKMAAQQTIEFMKLSAIKGVTIDPDGNTIADMFALFGIDSDRKGNYGVDFVLGTASTDVKAKITELKSKLAKYAKTGGRIGQIEVVCSQEFFNKLVNHDSIKTAYTYYQNEGKQRYRDNLARFEQWGIVDTFEYQGIMFWTYDAEFNVDAGDGTTTTTRWISANPVDEGGYTIVRGTRGVYEGYYGPANTLSGANQVGQEMFAYQYTDPKDKCIELELEMAGLYVMRKPQLSFMVHSSN